MKTHKLGADGWLSKHNQKDRKRLRRHRRERKQRGWSVYDCWSADLFLVQLIGEIALWHRDNGIGHPLGLDAEEWHDTLTQIGEPLVAYAREVFDPEAGTADRLKTRNSAVKALHLFADNFQDFWD